MTADQAKESGHLPQPEDVITERLLQTILTHRKDAEQAADEALDALGDAGWVVLSKVALDALVASATMTEAR